MVFCSVFVRLYVVHLSSEVRIFPTPLSILIPAIDIPPPICYSPPLPPPRIHTHARSRFTHPRHFLFRICFSSCMAQKPCATYAIYALAFNVSHPKSLFVTLLDCLLTTVLTAESRRQDTSGYTDTSQIDPWCVGARHTGGSRWKGYGRGMNWMEIVGTNVFQ